MIQAKCIYNVKIYINDPEVQSPDHYKMLKIKIKQLGHQHTYTYAVWKYMSIVRSYFLIFFYISMIFYIYIFS